VRRKIVAVPAIPLLAATIGKLFIRVPLSPGIII